MSEKQIIVGPVTSKGVPVIGSYKLAIDADEGRNEGIQAKTVFRKEMKSGKTLCDHRESIRS
jgi:hypothetical protein